MRRDLTRSAAHAQAEEAARVASVYRGALVPKWEQPLHNWTTAPGLPTRTKLHRVKAVRLYLAVACTFATPRRAAAALGVTPDAVARAMRDVGLRRREDAAFDLSLVRLSVALFDPKGSGGLRRLYPSPEHEGRPL